MKTRLGIAVLAATLAGCGVASQTSTTPSPETGTMAAQSRGPATVAGEIIIGSRPEQSRMAMGAVAVLGAQVKSTFTLNNTHRVLRLPAGLTAEQAIEKVKGMPGVAYAAPNRVFTVNGEAAPEVGGADVLSALNDPMFGQQWAYKKAGMPRNWANLDASNVLVAVADTGVDDRHPDFGRVIRGKNFADNNDDTMDRYGHGTHVAGSIGAKGNNGQGVAGVVWNAPILAVKVLGDSGSGTTEGVAAGMKYAADQGAKVINMSLGSNTTQIDPVMHDALQYCLGKGAIVICAAGNNSGAVGSPANDPLAVAVSSTSNYPLIGEKLSFFSSRGPQIWVAAPGDGIVSTLPTNGSNMGKTYGKASGTSMACPFAAGTATMIRALHPDWSVEQVREALKANVDDLGSKGRDNHFGWGRVNLDLASK